VYDPPWYGKLKSVLQFLMRPLSRKGHLEPNYESFVDWDEDVHGTIDSVEIQQEYPENFLWTCCERDGTSYGCVHGSTHEPVSQSKRRRLRK
jgi:hypothetical protein